MRPRCAGLHSTNYGPFKAHLLDPPLLAGPGPHQSPPPPPGDARLTTIVRHTPSSSLPKPRATFPIRTRHRHRPPRRDAALLRRTPALPAAASSASARGLLLLPLPLRRALPARRSAGPRPRSAHRPVFLRCGRGLGRRVVDGAPRELHGPRRHAAGLSR